MKTTSLAKKLTTTKTAVIAGGALIAGSLAFGLGAFAEDPEAKTGDSAEQERPKACQHAMKRDGNRGLRGPRGGHEGYGRPDGPPHHRGEFGPPERRGGYGRPDGPPRHGEYGPPPHRSGYGRPDGPPPRNGFEPQGNRDGYGPRHHGDFDGPTRGPERYAHRAEEGHRSPPPHRGGYGEARGGEFRDSPPQDRGPRGFGGPRHRPGPPVFEEIDADGNGAISGAEYKAFHKRRPSRGHAVESSVRDGKNTAAPSTPSEE